VVGIARRVADAVSLASETRPDVLLLDYYLPDGTGTEAAAVIRQELPEVAIVVLTAETSDEALLAAIEVGACAFLEKSQTTLEVVDAIRRGAAGEILIPATVLVGLIARQAERAQHDTRRHEMEQRLSQREHEILCLVADGLSNQAIAARLVISMATVRTHVQTILQKLGAHSKLQAVALASRYGLLNPPDDH
jgi:DNA-binding NarL/FixJ family response regulator